MVELEVLKMPQVLSPCNSGRRSNDSNSPEFEFSSFPEQELHSADELFSGGVILPLHHLHHHSTSPYSNPPPPPKEEQTGQQISTNPTRLESESSRQDISADISNLSTSGFTSSNRWKDIFKKTDKKCSNNSNVDINNNNNIKGKGKEKDRKKEKRNLVIGGSNGVAAAELNINIWPFRRSRSAGNGGMRPRAAASGAAIRKVSSAPCSRSNSAGESKSRKWPSSPSRGGVHIGRSSPIWQVRRTTSAAVSGSSGGGDGGRSIEGAGINPEKGTRNDENQGGVNFPAAVTGCSGGGSGGCRSCDNDGKSVEKGTKKDGKESCKKFPATGSSGGGGGGGGQKGKTLNLNVPMCIRYRSRLGCRSDEHSAVSLASTATGGVSGGGGAATMEGVRGGNLFSIRSLFTKKVY
ncbi:hypothetical protein LIER_40627 [Lithospermum erythrorhizon]|uniref:Uncharacterized protein n=1 Tax=Lithospermum erythrorhizon TaxID=34254 RepID=A0AAV3R0E5_LITER